MADARAASGTVAGATPSLPMHVLCYSKRPEDLYLRKELKALMERIPQIRLYFSATELTEADAWRGGRGRPSTSALREHLPLAESDARVYWCGPPPFNDAVRRLVREMGYTDNQVHELS